MGVSRNGKCVNAFVLIAWRARERKTFAGKTSSRFSILVADDRSECAEDRSAPRGGKTKKKSRKEETSFVKILFYVIKLIGGKYEIFVRCQRKSREKPNLSGTSWKSRTRRVVNESKYCEDVPLDSHFPPNRKLKARSKKKILIFSLLGAIKSEKNLIQTHTRASRREK